MSFDEFNLWMGVLSDCSALYMEHEAGGNCPNMIWMQSGQWYDKSTKDVCLLSGPSGLAEQVRPQRWKTKKKPKKQIHTGHRLLSNLFSAQLVLNEVIMTH